MRFTLPVATLVALNLPAADVAPPPRPATDRALFFRKAQVHDMT